MVDLGDVAPDFTLPSGPETTLSLASLRGKTVVLAFYPLDFTGSPDGGVEGTLRQFEASRGAFEANNTVVVAISADSIHCHRGFADSLGGLGFPLLSDSLPRGEVSQAYGVWAEARSHPRSATFIIDSNGIVQWKQLHGPGGMPDVQEVQRIAAQLTPG